MYSAKLDVVIVGGSLAGLWTGIVLQRLPNVESITILERFQVEQLQDLGAGIRTNGESIDAIKEYTGVGPETYGTLLKHFKTIDREGNVFFTLDVNTYSTTWAQLHRVFREDFERKSSNKYRVGCKVDSLEQGHQDKTITVGFTDENGQRKTLTPHLVIGADGASSTVRSLMDSGATRKSAGYCCYRGVTPYKALSEESRQIWKDSGVFHRYESTDEHGGSDLVSYLVPGNEASADKSRVVVNWVWYRHKTETQLASLLVDRNGIRRTFSLPPGSMREEHIKDIKSQATQKLPPCMAEVITTTNEPFLQLITDSSPGANFFMDGCVLLVGDAVGGQRPHTASAFLQATFHGLLVGKLLEEKIDAETWSRETQQVSSILVEYGKEMGAMLMSNSLTGPEKAARFGKLFMDTQIQLNTRWRELIGIGDSIAKV